MPARNLLLLAIALVLPLCTGCKGCVRKGAVPHDTQDEDLTAPSQVPVEDPPPIPVVPPRMLTPEELYEGVRNQASEAWASLGPIRQVVDGEAVEAVTRFLVEYGDIEIRSDAEGAWPINADYRALMASDPTYAHEMMARQDRNTEFQLTRVEIPEVVLAQMWLNVVIQKPETGGVVLTRNRYEMIRVEGGTAWVGLPDAAGDAVDVRSARISRPFMLGTTEVTQRLYEDVMGVNPSIVSVEGRSLVGPDLPVQNVRWMDAILFCNRLSDQEGLAPAYVLNERPAADGRTLRYDLEWKRDSDGYRLPTETEWEMAARAGASLRYAGTDYNEQACGFGNVSNPDVKELLGWDWDVFPCYDSFETVAPVGRFRANPWGFFDQTGNVSEWVWDLYFGSFPGVVDPVMAGLVGGPRGYRGGSWLDAPTASTVWARAGGVADTSSTDDGRSSEASEILGFRIARSCPAPARSGRIIMVEPVVPVIPDPTPDAEAAPEEGH